ncbi:MAG: hypothetical protein J3R72DRAFT_429403 [Linnemannia gamsii]|nr:MAG: hypothetical protein J3R72DRAFT_429403 [Linnemannia gamsii]
MLLLLLLMLLTTLFLNVVLSECCLRVVTLERPKPCCLIWSPDDIEGAPRLNPGLTLSAIVLATTRSWMPLCFGSTTCSCSGS